MLLRDFLKRKDKVICGKPYFEILKSVAIFIFANRFSSKFINKTEPTFSHSRKII